MLLPQNIQRPVAADGEQPLSQVPVDRILVRCAQLQERLLNHVARCLGIAEQPRRVERQRPFKASHRVSDPRLALGVQRSRHHPARKGTVIRFTINNVRARGFLDRGGNDFAQCIGRQSETKRENLPVRCRSDASCADDRRRRSQGDSDGRLFTVRTGPVLAARPRRTPGDSPMSRSITSTRRSRARPDRSGSPCRPSRAAASRNRRRPTANLRSSDAWANDASLIDHAVSRAGGWCRRRAVCSGA